MKQGSLALLIAVWCVGSALMLTGCGGGGDEGAPSGGPAVGTWTLTDDRGTTVILSLAQSGDRVAGTVVGNAAQAALRSSSANGVVSGEVDGNSISLVIVYDDGHTVYINGTISGESMAGQWSDSEGARGTVSTQRESTEPPAAEEIPTVDVSGTWRGPIHGTVYPFSSIMTVTLTQNGESISGSYFFFLENEQVQVSGPVTGSIYGGGVSAGTYYAETQGSWQGTVNGNFFSGTWADPSNSGTFTLTKQ